MSANEAGDSDDTIELPIPDPSTDFITHIDVAIVDDDHLWAVAAMNAAHVDFGHSRVADFVIVAAALDNLTPGHAAVIACGPSVIADALARYAALRRERPEVALVFAVTDTTDEMAERIRTETGQEPISVDDISSFVAAIRSSLDDQRSQVRTATAKPDPDTEAEKWAAITGPCQDMRIVTVTTAKGGTGATTVAINLAAALASISGERVVIVDGHKTSGDVGFLLGLTPGERAGKAASADRSDIDDFDINQETVRHFSREHDASGLTVVTPPWNGRDLNELRVDQLLKMLVALEHSCDVVVVDVPLALAHAAEMITYSNSLIFVTSAQLSSLKRTLVAAEVVGRSHNVGVITNETRDATTLDPDGGAIEDRLQMKVLVELPYDDSIAIGSVSGPVSVLSSAKSKYTKDLRSLAEQLLKHELAGGITSAE